MSDAIGFASFVMRVRSAGVNAASVLNAIERAERDRYLHPDDRRRAHAEEMLPLPCGQATERLDDTVRLVQTLDLDERHRVLEIGTGSGFLTDLLAQVAKRVVTLERYRTLLNDAKERHAERELRNITYHQRDANEPGDLGGSFDRIVSTIAFEMPPKAYVELLIAEGIMVAPIGPPEGPQIVTKLTRIGSRFEREALFEGWFPAAEKGVAHAL